MRDYKFDDKNVGENKTVSVTISQLTGEHVGNYNLTSTTATANIGIITPKTLNVTLTGSVTKTYDGTDAATLTSSNYRNLSIASGDEVSLNIATSGTYADKNAGHHCRSGLYCSSAKPAAKRREPSGGSWRKPCQYPGPATT